MSPFILSYIPSVPYEIKKRVTIKFRSKIRQNLQRGQEKNYKIKFISKNDSVETRALKIKSPSLCVPFFMMKFFHVYHTTPLHLLPI